MDYKRLSFSPCHSLGKIEFKHENTDVVSSAFKLGEKITINAFLPRNLGAVFAKIIIYDETISEVLDILDGVWIDTSLEFDIYEFVLKSITNTGIYFFRLEIKCGTETLYSAGSVDRVSFSDMLFSNSHFQLSITDFRFSPPTSLYGGIIYHIFVDRFRRGGEAKVSEGAILKSDEWDSIPEFPEYPGAPIKNNFFYGGTLFGIAEKLDYISSLGVNAIYLSPIFSSPSNHKYDTANYMSVDEMFGGDRALAHLIAEAKKRNIFIILDGVFNHTGSDSIYFNKYGKYDSIGAYQSKDSKYYDWYEFKKYPSEYTCWWGIDILPRINPDTPSCRAYFTSEGGVISKYRDMGIYGMRLDVVDELSDDFVADIKKTFASGGETVLYGEVWEDASNKIAYGKRKHYYLGRELDGVMNYPLRAGIIDYFTGNGAEKLRYALCEVLINSPDRIMHAQMNLLGTHDTERILTVLSGASVEGKSNAELSKLRMSKEERKLSREKLIAAYTLLGTLPGIPVVFYGDEAGLEGYNDPFNRMPYPWGKEDKNLISHYKKIGRIRKTHNDAYSNGAFKLLYLTDNLLAFSRKGRICTYVTLYNNKNNKITLTSDSKIKSLIHSRSSDTHVLEPYSAEIFTCDCDVCFRIEEQI